MNFISFIAKRLSLSKENRHSISSSAVRPALGSVALGIAVMIITVAVVTGFNNEIHEKLTGFASHIVIKSRSLNVSDETPPTKRYMPFLPEIEKMKGVKHVQVYAEKPGIIKTKDEIQGILLKGVDTDFDSIFFKENLLKGRLPRINKNQTSGDILISQYISDLLKLKTGDKMTVYFIQIPPRIRVFKICGIYSTDLENFDKTFALCDIKHIQKLNGWGDSLVSGFEVTVDNFNEIDTITSCIRTITGGYFNADGSMPQVQNVKEEYSNIFDWLSLSDMNIKVIIILMLIVAIFNLISGLLIIILEKTKTIGILKSLGADNRAIKKIFLLNGSFLVIKGLIIGNIIAFSILALQQYFGFVKLNPETYYVNTVPILIKFSHIVLLNLGTFIISLIFMILPTIMISGISPVKAIQFD